MPVSDLTNGPAHSLYALELLEVQLKKESSDAMPINADAREQFTISPTICKKHESPSHSAAGTGTWNTACLPCVANDGLIAARRLAVACGYSNAFRSTNTKSGETHTRPAHRFLRVNIKGDWLRNGTF